MPNQCVHCGEIYNDGSKELLAGCSKCSSRFFFYITEEKLKKLRETNKTESVDISLSSVEKKQVEKDVREIVGAQHREEPIILDFESVKILKPGKYLLNLHKLFNKERPLVYKLEDGKYIIDLAEQVNI